MKNKMKVVISVVLSVLLLVQPLTVGAVALQPEEQISSLEEASPAEEEQEAELPKRPETLTLGEIASLRTGNTKTFTRSDGTKEAAVYSEAVHFKDENGAYRDYDNTLAAIDGASAYAPVQNDIDFRIAEASGGKTLISAAKDGYTLAWTFEDMKTRTGKISKPLVDDEPETLDRFSSEIVYSDVFVDTDLQYVLSGSKLKENIILTGRNAPCEFTMQFTCEGLTPILREDQKAILLSAPSGDPVFTVEAPFAVDADGAADTSLCYELADVKDGGFTAVLHLDPEWLYAEGRAYPVTVDPVMYTEQELSEAYTQSAYVASATPNATYGRGGANYEGSLYAGYFTGKNKMRSFIRFNLPQLGTGDRIIRATMGLFMHRAGNLTVTLHNVTEAWQQNTVCWNNMPACETSIIRDFKVINSPSDDQILDFDITQQAVDWYEGGDNYGLMLKSTNESTSNVAWFFSSGYTSYSSRRPIVAIEYRNMAGYEDYSTYIGTTAGRGSADVNTFTGNLVVSQPLTADDGGLKMPVQFHATYNLNAGEAPPGLLGNGWKLNYQMFIRPNPNLKPDSIDEEKKYKYYFEDEDGTQHYFYFEDLNGTEGKDEDGLGYTLTVDTSVSETDRTGIRYVITDKTDYRMEFNGYGNLRYLREPIGNTIKLNYEGIQVDGETQERLVSVYDGAFRLYAVYYVSATSLYIDKIRAPGARDTIFARAGEYLSSIKYPDNKTVSFSYDASTQSLSAVNGFDGTSAAVSYTSGSVNRVRELKRVCGSITDEK